MSKRLSKSVLSQAMKQLGAKGGKASAAGMTAAERKARAKKASDAAAKKRTEERLARERAAKA
jgi:hypothetical protein